MKSCNEAAFSEIVKLKDPVLRHYCEWLIDAPTYGARIFANLAEGWGTALNENAANDFPETYKMLQRHYANDTELMAIKNKLQITERNEHVQFNA
jgi:hypothetical protein